MNSLSENEYMKENVTRDGYNQMDLDVIGYLAIMKWIYIHIAFQYINMEMLAH